MGRNLHGTYRFDFIYLRVAHEMEPTELCHRQLHRTSGIPGCSDRLGLAGLNARQICEEATIGTCCAAHHVTTTPRKPHSSDNPEPSLMSIRMDHGLRNPLRASSTKPARSLIQTLSLASQSGHSAKHTNILRMEIILTVRPLNRNVFCDVHGLCNLPTMTMTPSAQRVPSSETRQP